MRFIQSIILLVIMSLGVCEPAFASTHNYKIKAVVNGEAITDLDLRRREHLLLALRGVAPGTKVDFGDQVLNMLIDEKLLEQDAKSKRISVDDEEIAHHWKDLAARNKVSVFELKAQMRASYFDIHEFENQLRHHILQAKVLKLILEPQVNISEMELEELIQAEQNKDGKKTKSDALAVKQSAAQKKLILRLRSYIQELREAAYIDIRR
ncbi:MAG: SurA N-terminal domain-containing protein [Proteobacteria bacterium]|nr:SurA N-terminal domain-containing protein [Pseudomonadota bacterium]